MRLVWPALSSSWCCVLACGPGGAGGLADRAGFQRDSRSGPTRQRCPAWLCFLRCNALQLLALRLPQAAALEDRRRLRRAAELGQFRAAMRGSPGLGRRAAITLAGLGRAATVNLTGSQGLPLATCQIGRYWSRSSRRPCSPGPPSPGSGQRHRVCTAEPTRGPRDCAPSCSHCAAF